MGLNLGRRFSGQILLVVSVVLLFGEGFVETALVHDFEKGPASPQPENDLTSVYNDHGTLHYITEIQERLQIITIILPFVALAGIAGATYLLKGGTPRQSGTNKSEIQ
jgi:hypothetical protein